MAHWEPRTATSTFTDRHWQLLSFTVTVLVRADITAKCGCSLMMSWCLMSSDVSWHIRDKLWPMPKHGSIILYVHGNQKGSLGRTAQDVHLDSHTAPELCGCSCIEPAINARIELAGRPCCMLHVARGTAALDRDIGTHRDRDRCRVVVVGQLGWNWNILRIYFIFIVKCTFLSPCVQEQFSFLYFV